jgi:PAS domain S-box-containing protein
MNRLRIFIVEDEPIEALDLKNMLTLLGYTISGSAMSGEECIEQISSSPSDLIIMDIKLQGTMDGIDTAAELRKKYDIPVIFATALSDKASLARAKIIEPYGYINKPYEERELYTTIEMSLYKYSIDRRLRESEIKYRTLFEKSRDAIFISDLNGTITDVNGAMIELVGDDGQGYIGKNINDLIGNAAAAERICDEIREQGFVENREIILRRNDGTESECLLTCSQITKSEGADFGFQGIIRDISANKRLERMRDKLYNDKVKRINELNFLYRLSVVSGKIETPFKEVCREIIERMPSLFHKPDLVSIRLVYKEDEFRSANFRNIGIRISAPIAMFGAEEGRIEVYFNEKNHGNNEESYTKEYMYLVNAVAERLSMVVERKAAFEELHESREKLRNFSSHLQSLREDERMEIAREIHDILGQSLTALKMDISWIKNHITARQGRISEKLGTMSSLVDDTIDTVRRISSELRPGVLDDLGLFAAIEWYLEEFEKRNGIKCRLSSNAADLELDEMRSITIYRIFQESLTNIIRHANATVISVDLMKNGNSILLTVQDNGRGIAETEVNNPGSLGLVGIRERAFSCGGSTIISGVKGRGTTVKAVIPLSGSVL